jgi:hypothetical protein
MGRMTGRLARMSLEDIPSGGSDCDIGLSYRISHYGQDLIRVLTLVRDRIKCIAIATQRS